MGTIQSSIGLITGIPIQDTVDQLMSIAARPRNLLVSRAGADYQEQIAVTELTAKVLGVQFSIDNLGKADVFDQKEVGSTKNAALSAVITGEPILGIHQFTPVRTAQSHQLISSGVANLDDPLGGGSFSMRFGGFANQGIDLGQLNGGSGVQRGKIRITDRSGITSVVDLRSVRTVDDVIDTINNVDEINVTAVASGDSFKIVDNTGQTAFNLRVQEVGAGSTAADLGLAGIDVAASEATGADILRLAESTRLADLNGGTGVALDKGIPDIEVNLQDGGSPLFIDFNRAATLATNSVVTTSAGAGVNAQLTVAAVTQGAAYDDVTIQYVNDAAVTAGSETVVYDDSDPQNKTLTIHVEAGVSTAANVADAINNDATVGPLFSASLPGDGSGVVNVNEQAVTAGVPNQSAVTTTALNGTNAEVSFTAVATGTDYDGVTVVFVDNAGISQGGETVVYDDSDPQNKTLTFQIDAGSTTSADIAAALAGDATASQVFTSVAGGDGLGLIDVSDTAVTSGGEPTATAVVGSSTGSNSRLTFTSVDVGADFDNVTIQFVHDASITKGSETVAYSSFDKTLTFQISEGETTADDIVAALTGDSTANAVFTAELFVGGSGDGLVLTTPTHTTSGGAAQEASADETLGEMLATINAADPTRLHGELVGDRIVLTDLTTGGGTFEVSSFLGTGVAEDLGIAGVAAGDTLTGDRVLGGLKTTLLNNFNGGQGLGDLGTIELTDRSGATAQIDLSSAETLDEVIDAINNAGVGITASINDTRSGIQIRDTTESTSTNLSIQSVDATETAEKLGIVADVTASSVVGANLKVQTMGRSTKLSDLNAGQGISNGQFVITTANGFAHSIQFSNDLYTTVGDLLDAIEDSPLVVDAEINPAGDGIILIDRTGGDGSLSVANIGVGKTATQLNLVGTSVEMEVDGETVKALNAASTLTIDLEATDTLTDLITKINDLNLDVSASVFSDGSGATPHRLSLFSKVSGKSGELFVETSGGLDLGFEEIAKAQDALLLFGSSDSGGVLASSSDNKFDSLIEGVSLTVHSASTEPVHIRVQATDGGVVSAAQLFVDQYNLLREKLDEFTRFNEADGATGVLFGSNETLRIDTELSGLLTQRFFGVGDIQSLQEVGISVNDNGTLSLDSEKLSAKYNSDPDNLKEFFTNEDRGVSASFHNLIETLAGRDNSMLVNRAVALENRIQLFTERIEFQDERLERERERMLLQFYNMELVIGKLQNNLTAIAGIQDLTAAFDR